MTVKGHGRQWVAGQKSGSALGWHAGFKTDKIERRREMCGRGKRVRVKQRRTVKASSVKEALGKRMPGGCGEGRWRRVGRPGLGMKMLIARTGCSPGSRR